MRKTSIPTLFFANWTSFASNMMPLDELFQLEATGREQ